MAFSSQTHKATSTSDNSQHLINAIRKVLSEMPKTSSNSQFQLPPRKDQEEYIQDALHNEQSSRGVGAPPNTPSMAGPESVSQLSGLKADVLQRDWEDGLQIGPIGSNRDKISSETRPYPPDLSKRRLPTKCGLQEPYPRFLENKAVSTPPGCSRSTLRIDTSKVHTSGHQIRDDNTEIDSSPQEPYQFSKADIAQFLEGGPQSSSPQIATGDSVTSGESKVLFTDGLGINKSQSTSNGNECGPTGHEEMTNVDDPKDDNQDKAGQTVGATDCKLGFKKVVEVWDEQTSKYRIVESLRVETDDGLSQYNFIVRDYVDRSTKVTTTYIDIKSDLLRDVLRVVLCAVQSVSVMEEKPSVEQNALFHFISDLEEYSAKLEENAISSEPLTVLVDYLRDAYGSTTERLTALISAGQITYDILWALFKPGCIVYTTCRGSGKPRGVIFDAGEERMNDDQVYYQLECRFIDYDGKRLGEAGVVLGIVKFRGARPIDSLAAFPLQYHPRYDEVRQKLSSDGRRFCGMTSMRLQHCRGSAFIMDGDKVVKLSIDSRVAVDAGFFREMNPNYARPRISNKKSYSSADELFKEQRLRDKEMLKEPFLGLESMTDDDYIICSPTAQCFSFNEKVFLECAISDLADIEWNANSFDSLMLNDTIKNLLCSLTTARLQAVDEAQDKARGLIVLLYGASGLGKTFTVEALGEQFKLPLYSISVSELIADHGDPFKLDWTLNRIFKIAKHCRAVLLFDEADVFMERRTSHHSAHNRLVTIFLRRLEYHDGILFMTTNRLAEFDDAILSRVHLKVKYEQLPPEHRKQLWTQFLSKATTKAGDCSVTKEQIAVLALKKLNGREIRNLVMIASDLATVENSRVSYQHLQLAAKTNDKFAEEFNESVRLDMYT